MRMSPSYQIRKYAFILSGGVNLSKGHTGLGPNSFGWLRIIVPFQRLFYQAAKTHDIGYARGGTAEDRKRVDLMFFKMALSVSDTLTRAVFALFYLMLVRTFGWMFFNYKKHIEYSRENGMIP